MIKRNNKLHTRIILAITSVLIPLVLDQITKLLAISFLMNQPSVSLIPGILQLHYIENTGAAWGMLQDKTLWLALLSLAALGITTSLVIQALRHGTVLEIIVLQEMALAHLQHRRHRHHRRRDPDRTALLFRAIRGRTIEEFPPPRPFLIQTIIILLVSTSPYREHQTLPTGYFSCSIINLVCPF